MSKFRHHGDGRWRSLIWAIACSVGMALAGTTAAQTADTVASDQRVRAQVAVRDAEKTKAIRCRYVLDAADPGCVVEITYTLKLEFDGFDANQDTDVEVTEPDGQVRNYRVRGNVLDLFLEPGTAVGFYRFSAAQSADIELDGTFSVHAASERTVMARQFSIPAGESLDIMLAGFKSAESVLLHLYRYSGVTYPEGKEQSSLFDYVTTLGYVEIDDRGEAIVALDTPRKDPTGRYLLISDPPATRRDSLPNQFWLVADESVQPEKEATGTAAQLTEKAETDQSTETTAAAEPAAFDVAQGGTQGCGRAEVIDVPALSLRSEPTRESKRLGTVGRGGILEVQCEGPVDADERTWFKVKSPNGIEGWMSDKYLRLEQN